MKQHTLSVNKLAVRAMCKIRWNLTVAAKQLKRTCLNSDTASSLFNYVFEITPLGKSSTCENRLLYEYFASPRCLQHVIRFCKAYVNYTYGSVAK